MASSNFDGINPDRRSTSRSPVDDPLYPIQAYLCSRTVPPAASPVPGPPIISGEFIPEFLGETLIIADPWEDAPPGAAFIPTITEPWDYAQLYSETLEYIEDWFVPPFVPTITEPWDYSQSYSETLEYTEIWELFSFVPTITEPWDYSQSYSETLEYTEDWSIPLGTVFTSGGSGYLTFP